MSFYVLELEPEYKREKKNATEKWKEWALFLFAMTETDKIPHT